MAGQQQAMTHLLIVWSNGQSFAPDIIDNLKQAFPIHGVFHACWDESLFTENLRVFYSRSWQFLPESKLQEALRHKRDHCGTGPFTIVVFSDPHPQMEWRNTSGNQRQLVNVNVFDKKSEYRRLTGGGHLIHCSNNADETNRDLTLLFGLNTRDFLRQPTHSPVHRSNCAGVGGYSSVSELFYVLNNCIGYCVLRNFECLPDNYTVEGHGDIDLLVENRRQMACLTLARPVFSEPYRVYHTISIGGHDVPFDFRHIGDDYYDILWERHILKHRRLQNSLFYVPCDEDLFYSLLYHVYIQKHEVRADYPPKLLEYAAAIGLSPAIEPKAAIGLLDTFMSQHGYEYIMPQDKSVVYNRQNLLLSTFALRNGQCIKRTEEYGSNGYTYSSRVYENGERFVKIGTDWLIDNEARFLRTLAGSGYFPEILSEGCEHGLKRLELTKMKGSDFHVFFGNMLHQRSRYVHAFLRSMVSMLSILHSHDVVHRDISPTNLLIALNGKTLTVGLIDFGWAINTHDREVKKPVNLGGRYAADSPGSDFYALGVILMDYWPDVPYVRLFASRLFKAVDGRPADRQLKQLKHLLRIPFTPYDEFRLFLRRHQRISMLWHSRNP